MSDPTMTPLVLAGGHSTRFGRENKLLARHDGRSLLDHVVGTVRRAAAGRPVVAIQCPPQRPEIERGLTRPRDVRFVVDDSAFEGPVAGIFGGLEEVGTSWAFVCAGDMPLLRARAVRYLRAERPERQVDAIVPVLDGTEEPLHALYRRRAVESIRADTAPDAGAHALLRKMDDVVRVAVSDAPALLEESLTNVNTQHQLTMLEATDANYTTEVSIDG